MKKYLLILSVIPFVIFSCGGEESGADGASGEVSNKTFYINLEGEGKESNKKNDCQYMSDGIADETNWNIETAEITMWGFDSKMDEEGPEGISGSEFKSEMKVGDKTEKGTATFTSIEEGVESSMGTNYIMKGDFKGDSGAKGSFSLAFLRIVF